MISEEFVTTKIVTWLINNGWAILCYDFPQSGTGFSLRPNGSNSKNKDIIIPDIVARKDDAGLLFENKDRFFLGDFNKVEKLRTSDEYSGSLTLLFEGKPSSQMYFGIGFPYFEYQIDKAKPFFEKIDFLVTVTADGEINDYHNPKEIKFYGQDFRKTDNED